MVLPVLVTRCEEKRVMEELRVNFLGWLYVVAVVLHFCTCGAVLGQVVQANGGRLDYRNALEKSLKFFEAQRSGKLPPTQRVTWRGDSGMSDGLEQDIDLTGGYYDAGDNVKYGLPMAFTITMLSWNVIQFREELQTAGELDHALEAIKWGTDYFIKCHPEENVLWGEVGDGDSDHYCWMKPEHMTTSRKAYKIDAEHPGSDLAGETAAAMAAASIVFKPSNSRYSATLLIHARQLFAFADTYRGAYDLSIPIAQNYYKSWSGYYDELLWAALWLYDATNETRYLRYVVDNADTLGGVGWALDLFSWDNKFVGVQVKATKVLLDGNAGPYTEILQQYQAKAEYFLCAALQKNHGKQLTKSPDGMFWTQYWNNMQYVTSAAFLLSVASNYYAAAGQNPQHCISSVTTREMLAAAKQQVDYILGKNSRGKSYMIGFGSNFPLRVHHRGASIDGPVGCRKGYGKFYLVPDPNPFVLEGGIVGGPDQNDLYQDVRQNFAMAEPALYNTAPLVGLLAYLIEGYNDDGVNHGVAGILQVNGQRHLDGGLGIYSNRRMQANHRNTRKGAQVVMVIHMLVDQFVHNGKQSFKFSGKVVNKSNRPLKSAELVVHKLYGPLRGLSKVHESGNVYVLPNWSETLLPGQSIKFSYIHSYGKAQMFVRSYELA
ncbi:endoglucanase 11 [Physcomitrium patens]|uniref:Endoglucanase n=1 Tax=Physcomitrium patens TaxID=3218 RepID=A0A2K1KH71_PHYPA|nr:endoglucanase 11-like [Physcomitrium patens]PNR53113.1 hypothetical protein PHYPA_009488 [Physcomitrium patens]|eukprot:XP_024377257.1 endoglucanase 11-like [Physcomitrella patens]